MPVGLAAPGLGLLLRRAEAGLGPPLLGHVARDPDEPDDGPGLVVERDLRGREADVAAVRRRVLVLLVVERPAGLHHGPVRGVDLARERLGERVVDREPDGVLGALVPDGPGVGEVADDAPPLPVADEDGVRDGVDDRPEQALPGLDLVAPVPERLARPDLGHGGDPRQRGQDDVVAPEEGAPLPRRPGQDERRQERADEHAHGRPHPADRPGVRGDGEDRRGPGRQDADGPRGVEPVEDAEPGEVAHEQGRRREDHRPHGPARGLDSVAQREHEEGEPAVAEAEREGVDVGRIDRPVHEPERGDGHGGDGEHPPERRERGLGQRLGVGGLRRLERGQAAPHRLGRPRDGGSEDEPGLEVEHEERHEEEGALGPPERPDRRGGRGVEREHDAVHAREERPLGREHVGDGGVGRRVVARPDGPAQGRRRRRQPADAVGERVERRPDCRLAHAPEPPAGVPVEEPAVDVGPLGDVGVEPGEGRARVLGRAGGQGVLGDPLAQHPLAPGQVHLPPVGRLRVERDLDEGLAGDGESGHDGEREHVAPGQPLAEGVGVGHGRGVGGPPYRPGRGRSVAAGCRPLVPGQATV